MSTDEYVPTDDQVRGRYCDGTYVQTGHTAEGDEFDAWLDRVKRDAAREALDGLADEVTHVNWDLDGPAFALRVRRFKNRNYPEEAP